MRDLLLSIYPWLKAVHIIMVIAWMAAMMYLPRLFIYHHQASADGEASKFFESMERRLLKGIMTPSMMLVWLLALLMIFANPVLFSTGWFYVKIVFVLVMTGIHGFYSSAQRKFAAGEKPHSQKFWRIINEAPFVLLIVIVILAVVKPF